MRKQGLSRRERNMVEEAVTQVCWAMGVSPRDGELRQTDVYKRQGLGMAITKSLVAQMDGEISVQSQPGEGTVFTLVLPFAAARPEAVPPEPEKQDAPSLEGLRVLVAEDNEVNMEIVTELLTMAGAQVTQAWNCL